MSLKFNKIFKTPVFLLLVGTGLLFSQCKKSPTMGEIRVVELSTGKAIGTSTVTLYLDSASSSNNPNPTGFFLCNEGFVTQKEVVTNANGIASICFDTPALLNVSVVSIVPIAGGGNYSASGTGKLNLIEHETTSVTVKVN